MKYKGSYLSYLLMYLFYFLSLSLISGLISVYLLDKGYSSSQVSLVVSCSYILSVILQPIVGYLNDRYDIKKVNSLILLLSAISGISLMFVNNIILISLFYSLALGLFNSTKPIIERMALLSSHEYGRIRIWGTIGYAIGSQISGIIYQYISPTSMYLFYGIGLLICIAGILGTMNTKEEKVENNSDNKGIWNHQFIIYIIIVCIFYSITNLNSTYLPAMFTDKGISVEYVSTIILFITLSELPVIYFSHLFMNKISHKN